MSDSPFTGLAAAQAQVALLLAHGATVTSAAEVTGLHRSTIYRWIKSDDHFRTALHQGRAEYTLTLRDDLRELSEQALRSLMQLLTDPLSSPAVRLKASMFILNRPEFPKQGWAMPIPLLEPEDGCELTEDNPVIAEDYQRLREGGAQPAQASESAPPATGSEPAAPPETAGATECDTMRRISIFSLPAVPGGRPAKMPPANEESPKTGVADGEPAEDWPEDAA